MLVVECGIRCDPLPPNSKHLRHVAAAGHPPAPARLQWLVNPSVASGSASDSGSGSLSNLNSSVAVTERCRPLAISNDIVVSTRSSCSIRVFYD